MLEPEFAKTCLEQALGSAGKRYRGSLRAAMAPPALHVATWHRQLMSSTASSEEELLEELRGQDSNASTRIRTVLKDTNNVSYVVHMLRALGAVASLSDLRLVAAFVAAYMVSWDIIRRTRDGVETPEDPPRSPNDSGLSLAVIEAIATLRFWVGELQAALVDGPGPCCTLRAFFQFQVHDVIFLDDPPVRCAARLHPPPDAASPCQKRLRAKSGPVAAAEHPEARYQLCRLLLAARGRSPFFTNWLAEHPEVDVSTLEGIRDFEYNMHVLMRGDPALFCQMFFADWKTMEAKLPPLRAL